MSDSEQINPNEGQSVLTGELGLSDRLRQWIPDGDGYNSEYAHTLGDAADEIDRLQAVVARLIAQIDLD